MELIERGGHLDALSDHLAAAAGGNGRLVLVGGEAGVGKTSLVRASRKNAPAAPGSSAALATVSSHRSRSGRCSSSPISWA
jgi:predicted ATP-dependent serine protease